MSIRWAGSSLTFSCRVRRLSWDSGVLGNGRLRLAELVFAISDFRIMKSRRDSRLICGSGYPLIAKGLWPFVLACRLLIILGGCQAL